MIHHVPYSDDDATYHLTRLQNTIGHVRALSGAAMLFAVAVVIASAAIVLVDGPFGVAVFVLVLAFVLDLGRGYWSRSILEHLQADADALGALDADALQQLADRVRHHNHCAAALERWQRQRLTLRRRDANALLDIIEDLP